MTRKTYSITEMIYGACLMVTAGFMDTKVSKKGDTITINTALHEYTATVEKVY